MLHLAQVKTIDSSNNQITLKLLASRYSDESWGLMAAESILKVTINPEDQINYHIGLLVLADIEENKIISISDGTNWVLNLALEYLSRGITPEFLDQELQRIEKWRQELTLQSQELSCRSIEMEARQDQIQRLERYLNSNQNY